MEYDQKTEIHYLMQVYFLTVKLWYYLLNTELINLSKIRSNYHHSSSSYEGIRNVIIELGSNSVFQRNIWFKIPFDAFKTVSIILNV